MPAFLELKSSPCRFCSDIRKEKPCVGCDRPSIYDKALSGKYESRIEKALCRGCGKQLDDGAACRDCAIKNIGNESKTTKKTNKADRQKIISLKDKGKSIEEISEVVGFSELTVKKILWKEGKEMKKVNFSKTTLEERENIIADFQNGLSVAGLVKKYNRSQVTIDKVLNESHVKKTRKKRIIGTMLFSGGVHVCFSGDSRCRLLDFDKGSPFCALNRHYPLGQDEKERIIPDDFFCPFKLGIL